MSDDLDRAAAQMMRDVAKTDPLLVALGRKIAPQVNAALFALPGKVHGNPHVKAAAESVAYCPGCGEPSSWAPDLCPECLSVNAEPT